MSKAEEAVKKLLNKEVVEIEGKMPCSMCGEPGVRRRQNTAYNDDEKNFAIYCDTHQAEVDEYLDEVWADFRSNVG